MGDIAEMMLEGILDEQTGEYIGDKNEHLYGEAAPGFPISYERRPTVKRTDKCPYCDKLCAAGGLPLKQHIAAKHPEK